MKYNHNSNKSRYLKVETSVKRNNSNLIPRFSSVDRLLRHYCLNSSQPMLYRTYCSRREHRITDMSCRLRYFWYRV